MCPVKFVLLDDICEGQTIAICKIGTVGLLLLVLSKGIYGQTIDNTLLYIWNVISGRDVVFRN